MSELLDGPWEDWQFSDIEYTQDFSLDRTIEEATTGNLYEEIEEKVIDFMIFASIIDRSLDVIKNELK